MNKNGFTLVELIAVVAIMGIVALFGIPSITNAVNNNDKMACTYYKNSMKEAAKAYVSKELDDIIDSGGFPITIPKDGANGLVTLGYLEEYQDTKTTVSNASVRVTATVTNYNNSRGNYKDYSFTYTVTLTCRRINGDEIPMS